MAPASTAPPTRKRAEPPATRFGKLIQVTNSNGSFIFSTIDWDNVVRFESDKLADWILYLHQQELPFASPLLDALHDMLVFRSKAKINQQQAYVASLLTDILVDIVSEPDMFSKDVEAFKVRLDALTVLRS